MTDEGKRQLMRELSLELTDKKIAELMDQFADGVTLVNQTGQVAPLAQCVAKHATHGLTNVYRLLLGLLAWCF